MVGYRFYLEYDSPKDKRTGKHKGTVVALPVLSATRRPIAFPSGDVWCYEAITGLFAEPNSEVHGGAIAIDILHKYCKRIKEARARQIHPKLFDYIERNDSPME